jgi:hypothetical protein
MKVYQEAKTSDTNLIAYFSVSMMHSEENTIEF